MFISRTVRRPWWLAAGSGSRACVGRTTRQFPRGFRPHCGRYCSRSTSRSSPGRRPREAPGDGKDWTAMTEAQWKLVFDQQGVTIASDKFRFTTTGTRQTDDTDLDFEQQSAMNSAESSYMEAVVAELQTMTRRTYGQYCGLGRALEVVGERWTMLFIRDLLVRTKSLEQLRQGFPAVAPEIVSSRMRELEHCGVVTQVREEDGVTRYRL